jgi:hypothetical protein
MKDKTNYNDETFEAIYQKMREKFAPTPVTYTPVDEQTLAERISKVLRPMYDKAIAALFKGNQRSDAELDADAISRGMGSSTFVTDVKRRQDNAAAEGARDLESDYGAKMADQLYKAMEGEREKQLEVDKFNAQQKSAADAQAFEAAKVMYEAYLAAKKRHGSGGGKGSGSKQQQSSNDSDTKNSLAQAVAAARGKLPASPNGPGFYATGDRETVRRAMYSDLPKYVRMRNQMNGTHRASELQKFRNMYKQ